jgi:hypothetical protein
VIRVLAGASALVVLVLLAPLVLLGVAAAAVPLTLAATATGSSPVPSIGNVPGSLTAVTRAGVTVTLNAPQLSHAATIIQVAARIPGVGVGGARVALMAALTESSLQMLANTTAYPQTSGYPNDGDGSDHDSLGLFQMRPSTGWGTVADLMDANYQAAAFFGGPSGPNHGSPRGLLDIPAWQTLPPGEAAQAVEVSAFPDRYANYEPVADAILRALTT